MRTTDTTTFVNHSTNRSRPLFPYRTTVNHIKPTHPLIQQFIHPLAHWSFTHFQRIRCWLAIFSSPISLLPLPAQCLPSNWSRSCGTHPRRGCLAWQHWPGAPPSCPRRSRSECFACPRVQSQAFLHCHGGWQRGRNGHRCGSSLPPGTGSSWPAFSHTDTHTCWGWKCGFALKTEVFNTLRHF